MGFGRTGGSADPGKAPSRHSFGGKVSRAPPKAVPMCFLIYPTRIALGALYKEERSTPHNTKQESKGIHSKA